MAASGASAAVERGEVGSVGSVGEVAHRSMLGGPPRLRPMALQTSAEQPIPVRQASQLIAGWIARLGEVWVEGQVAELTRRPGQGLSFLTLRDPSANVSVSVTCPRRVLDAVQPPLTEGARVVVRAKPEVYVGRTSLALAAGEIRHIGVGELLARIERVKAVLAAEGLFAAERKRPLPFLPRVIGLISGRGSAAERDVLENARRRWPAVEFRVESVATQGAYAVTEVTDAIAPAGRRPPGRRDRGGPRRRLGRRPAPVLRRGPGPRGRRVPHAAGERDRTRAGLPPARPGR